MKNTQMYFMKWMILVVLLFFMSVSSVTASSYRCNRINDDDQKNMCLAQVKGRPSYCNRIDNDDLKNMCLAQVKGRSFYCNRIDNSDMKNMCKAYTR